MLLLLLVHCLKYNSTVIIIVIIVISLSLSLSLLFPSLNLHLNWAEHLLME